MGAILVVRHQVEDYTAWRAVYDELEPLRVEHGCTDKSVAHATDNADDLFITHLFPSVKQADEFAHDPALRDGMARAGVTGAPRIEIFESV